MAKNASGVFPEKRGPGRPRKDEINAIKTNEEIKEKAAKQTKEFMRAVRDFLATKAGYKDGEIPPEWSLSTMMLETYYREFYELTLKIEQMPSLTIVGRYGETPAPILLVRDKAAGRLESLMKQMGLTLRASVQLGTTEPQKEPSALDRFLGEEVEYR